MFECTIFDAYNLGLCGDTEIHCRTYKCTWHIANTHLVHKCIELHEAGVFSQIILWFAHHSILLAITCMNDDLLWLLKR